MRLRVYEDVPAAPIRRIDAIESAPFGEHLARRSVGEIVERGHAQVRRFEFARDGGIASAHRRVGIGIVEHGLRGQTCGETPEFRAERAFEHGEIGAQIPELCAQRGERLEEKLHDRST